MKFITDEKKLIGLDASLSQEQKDSIIDETLEEADNRYIVTSEEKTLILNGNSTLISRNSVSANGYASFVDALEDQTVTDISLAGDIVVDNHVVVTERDLVIDLAGRKMKNEVAMWDESNTWSVIRVSNATLTLSDTSGGGVVESLENDCYAIDIQDGGTVYIEGGTYSGNVSTIYLRGNNSACYIKGGYFKIQQLNSNGVESPYGLLINIYNEARNSAKCVITGGTFEGFDPAHPEEGGITYLPDGYTTQYDSATNTYTVIKEG